MPIRALTVRDNALKQNKYLALFRGDEILALIAP